MGSVVLTIMDVRLAKYRKFSPPDIKWRNDRRQMEQATSGLEVLVAKNFSKLALPCVALYPDVDLKTGKFKGFKVAVPDGPLKNHFEQEETIETYFQLFRDATLDAMAKKHRLEDGDDIQATVTVLKTSGVTKPPRPIWDLTLKELENFFTNLKTELAKEEGIKLRPKWPKIVNNVAVTLPTKLPSFDDVVETILPSAMYVPYQRFPPGYLHWRLKLVCAYLLNKYDLDADTFAEEIPQDFEPKNFDVKKLVEFSNNIEVSAEEYNGKKKRMNPFNQDEELFEFGDDQDTEIGKETVDDVKFPNAPSYSPSVDRKSLSASRTLASKTVMEKDRSYNKPSQPFSIPLNEDLKQEIDQDIQNAYHATGTQVTSSHEDKDTICRSLKRKFKMENISEIPSGWDIYREGWKNLPTKD